MTNNAVISAALESLAGPRHAHAEAAPTRSKAARPVRLLRDDGAWRQLRFERVFAGQPHYVGKAERRLTGP
jgi:hypothetical protein